jgi:hypothetical protein
MIQVYPLLAGFASGGLKRGGACGKISPDPIAVETPPPPGRSENKESFMKTNGYFVLVG